jgi:hypothetical protein
MLETTVAGFRAFPIGSRCGICVTLQKLTILIDCLTASGKGIFCETNWFAKERKRLGRVGVRAMPLEI